MSNSSLNAIGPVDGRYFSKTKELSQFFSEASLMRYRVKVEVEYFIALCALPLPQLKDVKSEVYEDLRKYYLDFSEKDANKIKEIEGITNHDVKAVEYFIKDKMEAQGLGPAKEFVHFGLTSQDINNTAIPMSLKDSMEMIYIPHVEKLIKQLADFSDDWKDIPMLAKTHGQPASPTRLGKEIYVFAERIQEQLKTLKSITYAGKFGGATGNFNAHHVAYPNIDWVQFALSLIHI